MPKPSETATEHLLSEMGSWGAIEIRVQTKYFDCSQNPKGSLARTITHHYIETGIGQRFLEIALPLADGRMALYTSYSDGSEFADVTFEEQAGGMKQGQVVFKRDFAQEGQMSGDARPSPLKFLYLEKSPLSKSFPKATYLGGDRHLGRDCDRLLLEDVKFTYSRVDINYCVDRSTGMPLEVQIYSSKLAREHDHPNVVWRATSFDRVDDHSFPLQSVEEAFEDPGTGNPKDPWIIKHKWENEVKEIAFNREYPKSIFRPVIEPGTMVWDKVKNKHYHSPNAGTDSKSKAQTFSTEPIRSSPPNDWTSTISSVGVVLGIAIVIASIMIRRRQ